MARFSQYPAASSTDYTDDATFLILAPDGTVKQATFEGFNDNYLCGIHCATVTIPTAEVLTLNSVPVAFGLTVPIGYYAKPLGCDVFMEYNSVAYVAAGSIQLWNAGINGDPWMTSDAGLIEFNNDTSFQLIPFNAALGASQIYEGADLAILITVAEPTTGNSNLRARLIYALMPI
jgi:hypothetical protein